MIQQLTPQGGFIATGAHIELVQLVSLKGRLKLEMVGLKSRGRATSTILKERFGWKGNREKLMEQLLAHIALRKREIEVGHDAGCSKDCGLMPDGKLACETPINEV